MPLDPRTKTAKFQFGSNGMIPKENPSLLANSQYRSCTNMEVVQEGSLSTRTGTKRLGVFPSMAQDCYMIQKMVVTPSVENPSTPSTNPRYLGVYTSGLDLYRTVDYSSTLASPVATGINTSSASSHKKAFSLAAYAAGETGGPWAFIASENKMLKDSGRSPYATLPMWGVTPAPGVATAVRVTGSPATITAIDYSYGSYTGVVITLSAPVSMTDFDQIVITGVTGVTITTTDGSSDINQVAGWAIRIGAPEVDGMIDPVKATTMFRIYDSNGQSVTGTGAFSGGTVTLFGTAGFPSTGNLDGGAESSDNRTQSYDYRYCYVDSNSGNKGNPSQAMLVESDVTGGAPVEIHNGQITVTVWSTGIANIGSIEIYRRGGLLFDAWRKVTVVTNTGLLAGVPQAITYTDNAADADIEYNELLEVDNDPPVPSTVTTSTGAKADIVAPTGHGRQTVTITAGHGSLTQITAGTILHCSPTDPEDVVVEAVTGGGAPGGTFTAYFQRDQAAGMIVQADAICGQPAHLAIMYQQFVLVAGDPNNPHLVYRSKGDQPEAFAITPADGSVATCACGTPSNPIMNMYEFRGQVATLNLYGIFETLLYNGSFSPASKMADKGTVGRRANCKVDNEIWFLSTDGVWSWDGGQCRKRTEAIDPIFHGQYYNGFAPLDYSRAAECVIERRRGQIYLLYQDIAGVAHQLVCEPGFNDRWRAYAESINNASLQIQFLYSEPDTDSLIESYSAASTLLFVMMDQKIVSSGINYTATEFGAAGIWAPPSFANGGFVIAFDMKLPWFDMGEPSVAKDFEEVMLELDTTGSVFGTATLTVELLYDFSDTAVDTFTVTLPVTGGRTLVSLLPTLAAISSHVQSYGKEARAISYHISGAAWPVQMQFFSLTLVYQETESLTAGSTSSWNNLGYPHDKRLYQIVVEYDAQTVGTGQHLVMDIMSGRGGTVYTEAYQTFYIPPPETTVPGASRVIRTMPVADGTVVKSVRLRPVSSAASIGSAATAFFKIFNIGFPEMEQYPPDFVTATPWEDDGYPFLKYINQATLVVDTNGINIEVKIQADDVTVSTQTVNATETDRNRNLTIPPNLTGRRWRLYVDPTQGGIELDVGKFQLWNAGKVFRFQPADKGEVGHTFDWDDLGHPYDKLLQTVVFEYDTTVGGAIILQMDTLTGIGGTTVNTGVAQFQLGVGRGKTEFPISPDTIVKMVRVYPKTTPDVGYKQWKYTFQKIDYPPDTIHVTEWRDTTGPTDREPSWLWLDADTGGIAASVFLENELGTVINVFHVGTATDRKRNYAIPVDTRAKMWRLVVQEGTNGKYQSFGWGFERWQPFDQAGPVDPPEIVKWTPWNDFGYPYAKLARNLIATINTNNVPCQVRLQTSDGVIQQTFSITTTYINRRVVIACDPEREGLLWRLLLTPGTGGTAQLWDWALDTVKEPPAVTQLTSYQQSFGYIGYKLLFQAWVEYKAAVPIIVTFVSSTGTYVITLPAHATRAVERRLFPAVWGAGLNKSVLYDVSVVSVDGTTPLSLYADASGIEFAPQGVDRHAGLQKISLSAFMTIPIA